MTDLVEVMDAISTCIEESMNNLKKNYEERLSEYIGPESWISNLTQELEQELKIIKPRLIQKIKEEVISILIDKEEREN